MQNQLTTQDLRDYAEARVQADRAARQAELCPWMQNIDKAMQEPLFQALRGMMGTENMGQDMALLQTIRHYRAKALDAKDAEIAALKAALQALLDRYLQAVGNEGIECYQARAAITQAVQPVKESGE